MQDRGLAAYIAELVGTFFLVFVIGTRRQLYVSTGGAAPRSAPTSPSSVSSTRFVLFVLIVDASAGSAAATSTRR